MARRKPLSRRAFLGGAAVMVGLPWLETLAQANTGSGPPLRLGYWYVPNGMPMAEFTPTTSGPAYALPPMLTSLSARRAKCLVLSNVSQMAGADSVGGDHARGTGAFLTAVRPPRPGLPVQLGASVDHVASLATAAQSTFLPSLHLKAGFTFGAGTCDSGYDCAFQNTITWSSATTPVPPRVDPTATFNTLFAGTNDVLSAAAAARRHARRESILDHVLAEANDLRSRVSQRDKDKVDQYLTSVRDLELRIANNPPTTGAAVCDPGTNFDPFQTYLEQVDQFIDLMVAAYTCDSTRVISFMADASGSYRSFPGIGVPEAHHEMSHHGTGDATEQAHRYAQWSAICAWHMGQFATFLDRLDAVVESDGTTLLDNVMIVMSSEIGDGNAHNHDDLPVVLAGGGCGMVDTGRHHRFASREPLANLFLGMLDRFGAPQSTFGSDGVRIMPDVFL